MGGNINFYTKTRRLASSEYHNLESRVINSLWGILYDDDVQVTLEPNPEYIQAIKAYRTKDSFGDMDIVINSKHLNKNYIDLIVEEFRLRVGDWSKNGNVLSFVYENFQIDLIVTPDSEFKSSLNYFAWNDCGNLVGRLSKKIGIKYGHRGCELIIKEGDYVIGEILLSRDNTVLFEILGLNHQEWTEGFDTLEQMFTWVAESKYFNKRIYLLENRNHYSRTRDAKRKTYHEFLEWIKDKQFTNNFNHSDMTERAGYNLVEPYFTDIICEVYPHAKVEYDEIVSKYTKSKLLKQKIGGEVVMEITGLQNKQLGEFIQELKNHIEANELSDAILNMSDDEVKSLVVSVYERFKDEHGAN